MSVGDIRSFKRDHELAPTDAGDANGEPLGGEVDELDLRAEDDALVAAALEAEAEAGVDEDDEPDDAAAEAPRTATPTMTTSRVAVAADAGAVAAGHASPVAADRSRAPSTTVRTATACGSIPPCRTTPCTPSTGPATGRSRSRWRPTAS